MFSAARCCSRRSLTNNYASIATSQNEGGAISIDQNIYRSTTVKDPTSKKSLLHADYVSYYANNPTMLILQHNNLTQQQLLKIRSDLKTLGAKLRVIRVGIFEHAVRVATVKSRSKQHAKLDANSKAISRLAKQKGTKLTTDRTSLDVTQLLTGPVCAITWPAASTSNPQDVGQVAPEEVTPEVLKKTMTTIESTGGKLLLLGGKFSNQVFSIDSLARVSKLPGLDILRGQVLSVLGSPAARLSQLLGTPGAALSRTLAGRQADLEKETQTTN